MNVSFQGFINTVGSYTEPLMTTAASAKEAAVTFAGGLLTNTVEAINGLCTQKISITTADSSKQVIECINRSCKVISYYDVTGLMPANVTYECGAQFLSDNFTPIALAALALSAVGVGALVYRCCRHIPAPKTNKEVVTPENSTTDSRKTQTPAPATTTLQQPAVTEVKTEDNPQITLEAPAAPAPVQNQENHAAETNESRENPPAPVASTERKKAARKPRTKTAVPQNRQASQTTTKSRKK